MEQKEKERSEDIAKDKFKQGRTIRHGGKTVLRICKDGINKRATMQDYGIRAFDIL